MGRGLDKRIDTINTGGKKKGEKKQNSLKLTLAGNVVFMFASIIYGRMPIEKTVLQGLCSVIFEGAVEEIQIQT